MEITVEQLLALGASGATIINVGKHAGSREIRGAVRYRPHDLLASEHLALPIPVDKPVVLYDENGDGKQTGEIAQKLAAAGFDARILHGGFAACSSSRASERPYPKRPKRSARTHIDRAHHRRRNRTPHDASEPAQHAPPKRGPYKHAHHERGRPAPVDAASELRCGNDSPKRQDRRRVHDR